MPAGRPFPGRTSPAQLTILVVSVVAVYFIIAFYGKTVDSYKIDQRAARVRSEIAQLERENRELQSRVARLSTDQYVATAARDKLNFVQPRDHPLVAVPLEEPRAGVAGPPASSESARAATGLGHLDQWLALFFGDR